MGLLNDTLDAIKHADTSIEADILAHLDDLTKPQGSLGKLEQIARKYCLATGAVTPKLGSKTILCFAGDHGVAAKGVSAFPSEVTPQMVMNMLAGGAAINVLSKHAGADLVVIDIGVNDPLEDVPPGLCRRKVKAGTDDISEGCAMTVEEATKALEVGITLAQEACDKGVTLLGTGDMGIANTTPSSALMAALLGCSVEDITGRGTGIDDDGVQRKISVIKQALETNKEHLTGPLQTLAALGGLEIAGIAGAVLGAASRGVPIVIDGFISSAGALVAERMCEAARDYMFFSHLSHEKGHQTFMQEMGETPILDLELRLGEGTGAALAMTMIEASVKIYNQMATFSAAGISDKD